MCYSPLHQSHFRLLAFPLVLHPPLRPPQPHPQFPLHLLRQQLECCWAVIQINCIELRLLSLASHVFTPSVESCSAKLVPM